MTELDPHKDEYRGMRNPYHLVDLWDKKLNDWNKLTEEDKKAKLNEGFKKKYKKGANEVEINLFNPNGTIDEKDKWKIYPSPLYPFVDQWWDEIKE